MTIFPYPIVTQRHDFSSTEAFSLQQACVLTAEKNVSNYIKILIRNIYPEAESAEWCSRSLLSCSSIHMSYISIAWCSSESRNVGCWNDWRTGSTATLALCSSQTYKAFGSCRIRLASWAPCPSLKCGYKITRWEDAARQRGRYTEVLSENTLG